MLRVGLTGGIGSGKSTAANVFHTLGIPVYNSDIRAKRLMHDSDIRKQIIETFGERTFKGDSLDRAYLASIVFNDIENLQKLNGIVHPAVMKDFERWAKSMEGRFPYVIQENAILFEYGFDSGMDYTVSITAPLEERVERAADRDGTLKEKILERVRNQMSDETRNKNADFVIHNSETDLMLPQIIELHRFFCNRNNE